jgi:ADP-ribose pyrophosphatase YjhB (NUDIX family)
MNTGYMDEHYDLSATGHVEPNESMWECAIRETREEIGVTIRQENLKPIIMSQINAGIPYLNLVFICEQWEGIPSIQEPEKCNDIGWYSLDNLPKLCTPTLRILESVDSINEMTYVYVDQAKHDELMKL